MESGKKMSNSSSEYSKGRKETSNGIQSIEPPLLSTPRSKKNWTVSRPMIQTDKIGSSKYKRNPKDEIIKKESKDRENGQLSTGMRSVKKAKDRDGTNGHHDAVKVNAQPFSGKMAKTVTPQQEEERGRSDKKETISSFDVRYTNRNMPRNKDLDKTPQGPPRKDNNFGKGNGQQDNHHQRMGSSQQPHAQGKTQGHTAGAEGHTNKPKYEDKRDPHDPGHRSHNPLNNHQHEYGRQVHGQGDHHVHDRGSPQHLHHRDQDKHQQGQKTKHLVNDHHYGHLGYEAHHDHLHPHGHDKHTRGMTNVHHHHHGYEAHHDHLHPHGHDKHTHGMTNVHHHHHGYEAHHDHLHPHGHDKHTHGMTNVHHHHHGYHHAPHHHHHDNSHRGGARHHWYDQHHRDHHGHSQHDHDKHHHGHQHEPGHHSHGGGKQDIHHHGYAHNRHGKHCLHPHSGSSRNPSKLGDVSRKTVSGKHNRFHCDCCSVCSLDANIAFENTYKTNPESQFKSHEIRPIIKRVIEVNLKDRKYDPVAMQKEARVISDVIKIEIKALHIARYKLVCLVFIGQETSQSLQIASRCLWEKQFDNFASETVLFDDFFATGMVFATYYE